MDIAIPISSNPTSPIREDVMNIAITKPKLGKDSKAFLAKKHHMLIDGKWVEAKSGKTFEVEDPATQEVIAHVPAGDKADIDLAVAAARKAFESGPWSRSSRRLRRATMASRSPPRAATPSAAQSPCSATWLDGQRA